MPQRLFQNNLLRKFDAEVIRRLDLCPIDLPQNYEIEIPGKRIERLVFLETGIASTMTTFEDGSQVEVSLAGSEGVLGASALMGTKRSLNRVFMQIAGRDFTSTVRQASSEFGLCGPFQDLTLRYRQAQFVQLAQTAACNAHHSAEQRMARWLLLCNDRTEVQELPFSQEYIATMIGARRSTVTIIAGKLQARQLIRYTRGRIQVLDQHGLERLACECYRTVRDHLSNLAEYDSGAGMDEVVGTSSSHL